MSSIISFLLAVFPVLDIYATGIPSISIGELLLCLMLFLWFTTKKEIRLHFPRIYIIFAIYMMFFPLLQAPYKDWFNLNNYVHNILGGFLYAFIIIMTYNAVDINKTIKFVKYIAIFASFFLVFQEIVSILFQIKIPGLISGIGLSNEVDSDSFINHLKNSERFSSIFAEPAHFAQYVSLGLILNLFYTGENEKKRNNIKIAFLITIALLLSQSGNAIVTSVLIWGIWMLKNVLKKTSIFGFLKILTVLVSCVVGFIYFFSTNEAFIKLFNRTNEISGTSDASVSGYIRILRGYFLFYDFDWYNRIFGIGSGNVASYVGTNLNLYYVQITSILISYLNGIQEVLVSGGCVGLLFYFLFLRYVYVHNILAGRIIIMTLIALSLISSCYNNALWTLYIVVALGLSSNYLKKYY